MAQIIKRSGMWYSDFRQDGKRIRRALSPYKERAEELLKDLLQIRIAEKDGSQLNSVSWFYFKEKYLNYSRLDKKPKTYDNDWRAFLMIENYGRPLVRLNQMTPEYLDDFRLKCKAEGIDERTVSGYVRRMKTAMHKAEFWDLIPLLKWKNVKCVADGKRTGYLSYPDFQRVLNACKGPYYRSTMILGWSGLRRGELLNLEWSDIDFKNHVIHVREKADWAPKGSKVNAPKERVVDMTKRLEAYLQGLPERTGRIVGDGINNPDAFTRYYNRLGERLGLHLFPHLFRHTCASFLISTGSTPEEVGALLGQTDIRSTKIYTHMMPHARRHSVDRMESGMENVNQAAA